MPDDDARRPSGRPSLRSAVPTFEVMRVYAAAQERHADGLPVYDLSAGQPSTPAPLGAREAAVAAIGRDRLGYTSALGFPALREAIAEHHRRAHDLAVEIDDVVVTTGSSGGLQLAFLAAFDSGDRVAVTRPGYPAYPAVLAALGCEVVDLPLDAEMRLTVDALDRLEQRLDDPLDGLVIASPANPTGTMLSAADVAEIARWCEERGVRLISDEIYHGITYGERAHSVWETSREAIALGSFSKYFAMTGWRVGWLLLPRDLRDAVERLASNFTICPPAVSQHAAIGALADPLELEANVARYRQNRTLLLDGLRAAGITRTAPVDGAFYVYADVAAWTSDSLSWAAALLDATGVAVAPGVDFDAVDGGQWIRLCFAGDTDRLAEATIHLGEYLAAH